MGYSSTYRSRPRNTPFSRTVEFTTAVGAKRMSGFAAPATRISLRIALKRSWYYSTSVNLARLDVTQAPRTTTHMLFGNLRVPRSDHSAGADDAT